MNTINSDGGMIYRFLKKVGFQEKFAQWITAQSAHETANFSSHIYKQNYNAFGMKYVPGVSLAKGEKDGYAYYDSFAQSVDDYKRLYKSYGVVSVGTVESFVKFLKDMKYFEATIAEYLAGMKHFLNLYFPGGKLESSLVAPAGASGTW